MPENQVYLCSHKRCLIKKLSNIKKKNVKEN